MATSGTMAMPLRSAAGCCASPPSPSGLKVCSVASSCFTSVAHRPASQASRFYGVRLAAKCEGVVSKNGKWTGGITFAAASVDTSANPNILPTWADFEMGYYPVYSETATCRPPTSVADIPPRHPPPTSAKLVPRRHLLLALPPVAIAILLPTPPSHASPQPTSPAPPNSFLRSLGIGDADIYYPSFFEGTWNCFSTLTAVETPQGEDKADRRSLEFSRKQLGYTVEYKARFVSFQGNVIGDRKYTTSALVESTMGKDVIRGASWDPEKPSRLSLTLRGGVKVENLVTKRSAEVTGPGQFDTSEFSKQVFDNSAVRDGPPSVKASQNLTRYRWDPTVNPINTIEAFQRVAMFPLPRDGMDLSDVMGMDKPVTLYKYRVQFTRESDS